MQYTDGHIPVLLHEVIEGLEIKPDDVFVDGTINGGGHSAAIASLLGEKGALVGIDLDTEALKKAKKRLADAPCAVRLIHDNYRTIDSILRRLSFPEANKILLDLGMSSNQLDPPMGEGRGFSFLRNEPLLMTFKSDVAEDTLTAKMILNTLDAEALADIIYKYGEERFARQIARKIIEERKKHLIETTFDLVSIIKSAVPKWYGKKKIHFATKTFQAIRIAVNDEIATLKDGLAGAVFNLSSGGRVAVISFHSIEDRIVKNFFRDKSREGAGVVLTKKPITPGREEMKRNPRSRSAKLRIFEKT